MARAMSVTLWVSLGTCFISGGCGPSQHTQATDGVGEGSHTGISTPAERLARVRHLAADGPEAEGAPEALVEALINDDDRSIKKVAAVGLLSFGDKALGPLRKKMPPRDTAPSKAPNPQRAPDDLAGVVGLIVYHDPYFLGGLLPACEELAQDKEPAIRVVGVRALAATQPQGNLKELRAAADNPKDQFHDLARNALKQRDHVLDALHSAAKDPDERVREAAKEALKRLTD